MNRPSIPLLLVVLAAVIAFPLNTRARDLRPGDRVRVNATDGAGKFSPVTGTVVSLDDEALVIEKHASGHLRDHDTPSEQTRAIPLSSITSVDRWTGTRNHTFTGAVIGAATGLVIGFATRESSQTEGTEFGGGSDASGLSTLLLGIVGTGVGALIGHSIQTDQWEPVDSFIVAVTPADEGIAQVALGLSFDL